MLPGLMKGWAAGSIKGEQTVYYPGCAMPLGESCLYCSKVGALIVVCGIYECCGTVLCTMHACLMKSLPSFREKGSQSAQLAGP